MAQGLATVKKQDLHKNMPLKKTSPSDYHLSDNGHFTIKNYHLQKPFSNFLPGIAGLCGTPMWVFYVNRGQGIASFGTRNKDNAILEFFPANKAYQMTPSVGFRTFLKVKPAGASASEYSFFEPFKAKLESNPDTVQSMQIASHELVIREDSPESGIGISVAYYTVPDEPLAVLARAVTLTNLSDKSKDIEILDGLPAVNPYGMNEFFVKNMSRTIEAWMMTENMGRKAPFFRLKVDATDRPEVELIREGNFYFSYFEEGKTLRLADPIVDPAKIFGERLDFSEPVQFFKKASYGAPHDQITENKTPSAFSFASFTLPAGKSTKLISYFGQASDVETLRQFCERSGKNGYAEKKREDNELLIDKIKTPIFSVTSSRAYDLYCGQTYLDNVMRGGLPVVFSGKKADLVYYAYSRKHGDLERDYNRFLVEPAYFAQGDGNYRDVNQNRRKDVWFEPKVCDANIKTFLNLIQLDGFNPLVVKGNIFHFKKSQESKKLLKEFFGEKNSAEAEKCFSKPFSLGALCRELESLKLLRRERFSEFLAEAAPYLQTDQKAEHGEGFWVDHWAYNLDLIESYLAIYPENQKSLIFGSKDFTFFDNDHVVRGREEKYFLHKKSSARQFQSVFKNREKEKLIASRPQMPNVVRTKHGLGDIYHTTLFVKLLSLAVNKTSSLDPFGRGIEMEADKPSWYDALNGLPGLFGSSLCETFELKRLALFLIQAIEDSKLSPKTLISLPEELADFLKGLDLALIKNFKTKSADKNFAFWDEAASLREGYRRKTVFGVSGREKTATVASLKLFLEHCREKIEVGIESSINKTAGLYPTYFENELKKFKVISSKGAEHVKPVSFEQRPLPFFLEGPVHAMKVEKDIEKKKALLKAIRESGLYDKKLEMYKVNAPMAEASLEIGRGRVFSPGWLENESIWLHMEYKFILELLKSGLYEEFYKDFQKVLVPFQPAERYGRSILENSSFIVSSEFLDPALHGTGFVARLSGSTAEFLNMWLVMNFGKKPFSLGTDGKTVLRFEPRLPSFLFTKVESLRTLPGVSEPVRIPQNAAAFMFLGKTLVVYHNPKRLDTFGHSKASARKIVLSYANGQKETFNSDTVSHTHALAVRQGSVSRIDIELG